MVEDSPALRPFIDECLRTAMKIGARARAELGMKRMKKLIERILAPAVQGLLHLQHATAADYPSSGFNNATGTPSAPYPGQSVLQI
jgi:hypothetical protein